MYERLKDTINGKEDNYMLPFFWLKLGHIDSIEAELDRIEQSGIKAFCVEARPYPEFVKDSWFKDMDIIMAEAEKRGMKVWVLDDDHFPTGHCAGKIAENPELRRWQIIERHIDVAGPMTDASLLINKGNPEHQLMGIYMYKRCRTGTGVTAENAVCLTDRVKGDFVYFDIPDGCYRIFFLYKSRSGISGNYAEYMDFFNPKAIDLYIETVHEAHYKRYGDKFGTVFQGFFSDEPQFGNTTVGPDISGRFGYNARIGMPGFAYPWGDVVLEGLRKKYGENALKYLPALWFDMEGVTAEMRLDYMNAITTIYRDTFTRRVGDWCRAHNVLYIGHVIEDMNTHARLSYGAGHYFRALDGQDMSGVDVVLHQVLPGFTEHIHTSTAMGNSADPRFFNYVLAKLASSMAHIDPQQAGRAMCEVFGAYGWAEGVPMMKHLLDHFLVRGINRFVPHAFTSEFPDSDCPPHFGAANGVFDPQFKAFGELMRYGNRVAHLLTGGEHVCRCGVLYHAEAEWMNPYGEAMLTEVPAKILYDAHIDFDILPSDCFAGDGTSVIPTFKTEKRGEFTIGKRVYTCLVIPSARLLAPGMDAAIDTLRKNGVTVLRMGENAAEEDLAALAAKAVPDDILIRKEAGNIPDLYVRCCHYEDGGADIYMFVNESASDSIEFTATLASAKHGCGTVYDLANKEGYSLTLSESKSVRLTLEKYQSLVVVIDGDTANMPEYGTVSALAGELKCDFRIEKATFKAPESFTVLAEGVSSDALPNITGINGEPDFSGVIRYTADTEIPSGKRLDLGEVGETAEVWLNGKSLGVRFAPPYVFDISGAVKDGKNTLTVEVSNTLANAVKDSFSSFIALPRSGLFGPLKVFTDNK